MEDAIKQNGEYAKKEGIAIVVANNGKVIWREVGTVSWRQKMVQQLEDSVNPNKEALLTLKNEVLGSIHFLYTVVDSAYKTIDYQFAPR
jgi:hypothetical protein